MRFANLETFRDHLAWAAPAYPHEILTPVIGTATTGKMAIMNDELEEIVASVVGSCGLPDEMSERIVAFILDTYEIEGVWTRSMSAGTEIPRENARALHRFSARTSDF